MKIYVITDERGDQLGVKLDEKSALDTKSLYDKNAARSNQRAVVTSHEVEMRVYVIVDGASILGVYSSLPAAVKARGGDASMLHAFKVDEPLPAAEVTP